MHMHIIIMPEHAAVIGLYPFPSLFGRRHLLSMAHSIRR